MTPAAILDELTHRGVSVTTDGERLHLQPGSAIPAELLEHVRAQKPALLALLKASGPNSPVEPVTPLQSPSATDPLLDARLADLVIPLPVNSPIVGRIYLCANDAQAEAVKAQGGVPYTPEEVAILRELYVAVPPDVWAERLRLIHQAKREFQGRLEP